jgi:hypothetical protein
LSSSISINLNTFRMILGFMAQMENTSQNGI